MTSKLETMPRPRSVLKPVEGMDWRGPFAVETCAAAVEALEDGRILYLPDLAFVPRPEEEPLLALDWTGETAKNISYESALDQLKGASGPPETLPSCTA